MTEQLCELWDLPVSMCGCPKHRGGKTPEEEAAGTWYREHYENRLYVPSP